MTKILIIESVNSFYVNDDHFKGYYDHSVINAEIPLFDHTGAMKPVNSHDIVERIHYKRYYLNGRVVIIGFSDDVSKALNLDIKNIERLEKELFKERVTRKFLEHKIEEIKCAGFFKRLKWLFTGVQVS